MQTKGVKNTETRGFDWATSFTRAQMKREEVARVAGLGCNCCGCSIDPLPTTPSRQKKKSSGAR